MRRVGLFLVLVGCSEVDVVDGSGGSASTGVSVSVGASASASTGASGSTGVSGSTNPGTGVVSASSATGGPLCGDGAVDPGEECDDGNVIDGDACSAGCVVECEPLEPMSMNEAVFKDPTTFHCYRWTGGLAPDCWIPSYAQAEADCADWNGDVAALSTLPELEAVVASGIVQPFALDVLLGARDVSGMGDWLWMNGEPWIYVEGMPPWNGADPFGTYLEMYYDGSFNADIDSSACGWVCERTPAGRLPPP